MTGNGPIWALGTMSGTSLDGVDAALVRTDGWRILEVGRSAYRPYSDPERARLSAALGQGPDGPDVATAAEVVERAHAELLEDFPDAEVVGFHGQTLAHWPERGETHQAGNGDLLAAALGRPVVWDFRSADMGLGGQGAPLAPFYHFAMAKEAGLSDPVAILNLGGVGNLTWLDPTIEKPEDVGACLAFDTGPGNALLDDLVKARRGQPFDTDGALAGTGTVDAALVARVLERPFFFKRPPKSLDRNDFADLMDVVAPLDDADAAATLAAITVATVAQGMTHAPCPPVRVYVTGGGRKNPVLMKRLADTVPCAVDTVETLGHDGDMLEAEAFAFLAVRVLRGLPTSAPTTTGVAVPVGGGRIARPQNG